MEAARAHPRGEWAPGAPGPGGDVAPVAVRPRRGDMVLYPFHGASLGTVSVWWWETCRQPEEGIEGSMRVVRGSRTGQPGACILCQSRGGHKNLRSGDKISRRKNS